MEISEFNMHSWDFKKYPEGVIITLKSKTEQVSIESTPNNDQVTVKYSVIKPKSIDHRPMTMSITEVAKKLGFSVLTEISKEIVLKKK